MKIDRDNKRNLTEFDADFPPENPVNIQASEERNLKYNKERRVYVDEDGCLIRDKFGQLLG